MNKYHDIYFAIVTCDNRKTVELVESEVGLSLDHIEQVAQLLIQDWEYCKKTNQIEASATATLYRILKIVELDEPAIAGMRRQIMAERFRRKKNDFDDSGLFE